MTRPPTARRVARRSGRSRARSSIPYLPGLDGMRALAVVAVMVYHANHDWLPGGFIGVEVFFVISGYLITLLLVGEHERTGRISLRHFWLRRARRLLPALLFLLLLVVSYIAVFERGRLGEVRGDVVAGLGYGTNWYQVWVGQGYTADGAFAPLRHLWSLAVEEQYYLLWPLIMVVLVRRGQRRLPDLSRWLVLAAVVITVAVALLYHPGREISVTETPEAYWHIGDRWFSKTDALYLSTITRSTGLLIGGAFALIWRPVAVMRSPLRNKGLALDLLAIVGVTALTALAWFLEIVTPAGPDPMLFRGGLFAVAIATVFVMATATHGATWSGALLGHGVLRWIGQRSYGLYLYHWPIYQIIRKAAGNRLTLTEFAVAMAITAVITEFSYRFVEMPVRRRHLGAWWQKLRHRRDPIPRRVVGFAAASSVALVGFAGVSMATAKLAPTDQELAQQQGADVVVDLGADLGPTSPVTLPESGAPSTLPDVATSASSSPPGSSDPGTVAPASTTVSDLTEDPAESSVADATTAVAPKSTEADGSATSAMTPSSTDADESSPATSAPTGESSEPDESSASSASMPAQTTDADESSTGDSSSAPSVDPADTNDSVSASDASTAPPSTEGGSFDANTVANDDTEPGGSFDATTVGGDGTGPSGSPATTEAGTASVSSSDPQLSDTTDAPDSEGPEGTVEPGATGDSEADDAAPTDVGTTDRDDGAENAAEDKEAAGPIDAAEPTTTETPSTDDASTQPTSTAPPSSEATTTDAPSTDALSTDAPSTDAPPGEATPTDALSTDAPTTTTTVAPTTVLATVAPTAAPPTVAPSAAAPVAQPEPQMFQAIGDSVMLGAAVDLGALGIAVDAQQSRQMSDYVPTAQALAAADRLGTTVIVHLGTNGSFSESTMHAFFDALVTVDHVIVLTVHADRGYTARNNELLMTLPSRYSNVTIVDWNTLVEQCPGDCLYDDGIHLPPAGRRYYAQLIFDAAGL